MNALCDILPYKKRRIDPNRPVWVYRNLSPQFRHTKIWSVMQDGLVVAHAKTVTLRDAKFVVRDSGRRRALKEGRRNVHAFAVGTFTTSMDDLPASLSVTRAEYNPSYAMFYVTVGSRQTGSGHKRGISRADVVQLNAGGLYVANGS